MYFYNNVADVLIQLEYYFDPDYLCVHPTNTTFRNCNFTDNNSVVLTLLNHVLINHCQTNVYFEGTINIVENTQLQGLYIVQMVSMAVLINGTVAISENHADHAIMHFAFCDVIFAKIVKFLSNTCYSLIDFESFELPYVKIINYANITFIANNIYGDELISFQASLYNIFPYCFFQYMVKSAAEEMHRFYVISFSGNKRLTRNNTMETFIVNVSTDDYKSAYLYYCDLCEISDFLSHCKWLPTAVFNGYDPGEINQQIIEVDGHQWVDHKLICYCPRDENYNCTVDLLGPVYPGQMLQVDLCIPELADAVIVKAETHAISLPSSVCEISQQNQLINSVGNYSTTFNLTIISENRLCELFLTVQPFFRTAFYVELLPCPVGFTLQNGTCKCDPFLPPNIDTCYIELSAIGRPANTWITAHTLTNNTNYLISDCPMDYCLPYSSSVNFLYPDLQCQFNRTGILCSQCQHPLSMVFASSRCMECTNVHILITMIVIVAGIVLVVLLYLLNLTVTNGTINGIIFYANIISINDSVFLVNNSVFTPLRVFISFTNLDLGVETCFYNGMDNYAKMWLQLFFPSYLIIIAVSIIIASRYSSRVLRLTYSRSLPVLATLFLLSYTGVLRTVSTVLFSYSTITDYPSGDEDLVWSIDASIPLFGLKFTILFITCLVLFLVLTPFNITLLFTRYLLRFKVINHFKPLLDAFQGSYKDKYYYWVAVNIIFRSIFFSLYAFHVKFRLILATISLLIYTGYYGYICPNKCKAVNFQELTVLINLTIMYTLSIQDSKMIFSICTNIMIGLAFLQFCTIVLYHFLIHTCYCKFSIKEKLMALLNKKKPNHCSYDVMLLNIPERTYNYSEYRDELVTDDFNNHM